VFGLEKVLGVDAEVSQPDLTLGNAFDLVGVEVGVRIGRTVFDVVAFFVTALADVVGGELLVGLLIVEGGVGGGGGGSGGCGDLKLEREVGGGGRGRGERRMGGETRRGGEGVLGGEEVAGDLFNVVFCLLFVLVEELVELRVFVVKELVLVSLIYGIGVGIRFKMGMMRISELLMRRIVGSELLLRLGLLVMLLMLLMGRGIIIIVVLYNLIF
jgi:hypothetical protein